ncbi:hypothetical protein DERP_007554 [Dermatophagoides pteronyssinus]|uniref:Uncharacterized protein n=1 Tax=Dermatophagoides pteronyssinus TaxID=6956 RepID=A0ABQ8JK35_DERPT|nr:hypothetical protein DERP_007554 [Dermatophagoides pteronyssinus]
MATIKFMEFQKSYEQKKKRQNENILGVKSCSCRTFSGHLINMIINDGNIFLINIHTVVQLKDFRFE